MTFLIKTKIYAIMPIDVQLSNVLTMPASENSLYFRYLHGMIYIHIVPCNLNRKTAITINQRNINCMLTRFSFKLSYRNGFELGEVLSSTRILFHFRILLNIFHNLKSPWLFQFKNLFWNSTFNLHISVRFIHS